MIEATAFTNGKYEMTIKEQPKTMLMIEHNESRINSMAERVAGISKSKGWDDEKRTFGDLISLMHSELSEALEEFRSGHELNEIYFSENDPNKPEGIAIELADCVIRIMHFCHLHNIDLAFCINLKAAYNETRPHKHGGKLI